ncbi:hypothetical protein SDJN03_19542, partial [Cucurbita argyrosperma subsp. sororia]
MVTSSKATATSNSTKSSSILAFNSRSFQIPKQFPNPNRSPKLTQTIQSGASNRGSTKSTMWAPSTGSCSNPTPPLADLQDQRSLHDNEMSENFEVCGRRLWFRSLCPG